MTNSNRGGTTQRGNRGGQVRGNATSRGSPMGNRGSPVKNSSPWRTRQQGSYTSRTFGRGFVKFYYSVCVCVCVCQLSSSVTTLYLRFSICLCVYISVMLELAQQSVQRGVERVQAAVADLVVDGVVIPGVTKAKTGKLTVHRRHPVVLLLKLGSSQLSFNGFLVNEIFN